MQADNAQITQELETSKKDEEELETFIETRQKELEDWKKDSDIQINTKITKKYLPEKLVEES